MGHAPQQLNDGALNTRGGLRDQCCLANNTRDGNGAIYNRVCRRMRPHDVTRVALVLPEPVDVGHVEKLQRGLAQLEAKEEQHLPVDADEAST